MRRVALSTVFSKNGRRAYASMADPSLIKQVKTMIPALSSELHKGQAGASPAEFSRIEPTLTRR